MADVFTKMLIRAANNNLISGLLHCFNRTGVISLQYADDTLLFLRMIGLELKPKMAPFIVLNKFQV